MTAARDGDAPGAPFVRATPNPVAITSGANTGATTIEWSTGDGSLGWVSVAVGDGHDTNYAADSAGSQVATWIAPGVTYRFTLYADDQRTRALDSVVVTTERPPAPRPFIRATPNPLPRGDLWSATTVEWSTGDGSPGWVFVSVGGGEERGFAGGRAGSQQAPWIKRDARYRFTLYADETRTRQLDAVVVTTEPAPWGPPFLRATPNPVPYTPRVDVGTTTVEWSTGDGMPGWVYVSIDGAEERVFATVPEGVQQAPWIRRGVEHRFTLYADETRTRPLQSVVVTGERPPAQKPFIRATPNPIPPTQGPELGATTIQWSTGDGSVGWVYLRAPGGKENECGRGPEGAVPVTWILRNYAYRFTLYADRERRKKLAAVTVAMGSPLRELWLDLGVLALAAAVALIPVLLVGWAVWRAWGALAVR